MAAAKTDLKNLAVFDVPPGASSTKICGRKGRRRETVNASQKKKEQG